MEHSHGSTAIDGMLYYNDDLWPPVLGQHLYRQRHDQPGQPRSATFGSSPKANELDDFVCDDWFGRWIISSVRTAPLHRRFYNRIIGHYEVPLTHPGRDRDRGGSGGWSTPASPSGSPPRSP
jgi:hypothetical protein